MRRVFPPLALAQFAHQLLEEGFRVSGEGALGANVDAEI